MSRPRKPFGSSHPGRLPATMVKVLAAEMSDPQRLRRGKQYAHDGSVTDIIIEPGVVTCEIQGSRPTPYIASVEVTPGDGMPVRRDITAHCSCPDDDNWDDRACKHVVAAMFAFSDELLIEPELLDVWRGREPGSSSSSVPPDEPAADRPSRPHSHLRRRRCGTRARRDHEAHRGVIAREPRERALGARYSAAGQCAVQFPGGELNLRHCGIRAQ